MTDATPSPRTEPTSAEDSSAKGGAPATHDRVAVLTDRRGALKLAGVVVGAGALAACSSPPVPNAGGGASGGGAPAATPTSKVPVGDTPAATPTSKVPVGGAPAATPTSEVPVGGGKVFPDTKIVVTQPSAGTFKAFDAVCPHQGCTVGSVESGQIICPCHQSHFDAATGDRVSGPAPTGLTPKTITVSGNTFTVS